MNETAKLWDLFLTFARIGGLTFGGGYAMLPMLQKEVVEQKKWVTEEELLDYYAVGQCTPGIIAVNVATFIGQKTRGVIGGIVATLGVVAPSFFIILVLASVINHFNENPIVMHALAGIRVAVAALIVSAIAKLWQKGVKDLLGVIIFAVVVLLSLVLDVSPIIIVVTALLFGIVYGRAAGKGEKK
ncbi:MAG: chromate transporter [Clostridia bacterium]|nr:chromate transporter [Clostridia bacterium]